MLRLEEQVANVELSRELKALGVKQESVFYWVEPEEAGEDWVLTRESKEGQFSAFTVAELGEMTKGLDGGGPSYGNQVWWWHKGSKLVEEKTEADARAARLIHHIRKSDNQANA